MAQRGAQRAHDVLSIIENEMSCSDDLVEVLTSGGFSAPQIEALKAGFPLMGVTDLHTFAYARKALDDNGINSKHEREYAAGKVRHTACPFAPASSISRAPTAAHWHG